MNTPLDATHRDSLIERQWVRDEVNRIRRRLGIPERNYDRLTVRSPDHFLPTDRSNR